MHSGISLIDEAVKVCGSRYAVAKRIGVSQAHLSNVYNGKQEIGPLTAAKLADVVGQDPKDAAAVAWVEGEKDPAKRSELVRLFKLAAVKGSATVAVVAMLLAGSLSPSDVQARTGATGERVCLM